MVKTLNSKRAARTDYRRVRFRKVKVPSTLRSKATLLISQQSRGGGGQKIARSCDDDRGDRLQRLRGPAASWEAIGEESDRVG